MRRKLPELFKDVWAAVSGIQWIRLQYCYPEEITDELIETIKTEEKVCNYLDIPDPARKRCRVKTDGKKNQQ